MRNGVFFFLVGFFLAIQGPVSAQMNPNPANPWEGRHRIHTHQFFLAAFPSGNTPARIRHAYGFDLIPETGKNQIIGIVDPYGSSTIQADLDKFSDTFGLPRTKIGFSYPQGLPRKTDDGAALETSLDVEWAHAIAPEATLLLVVAKSNSFNDLLEAVDAAVRSGARQISMSWGGSEFSSETAYDFHFNKPGVTFVAASGDSGSGVVWPAVSPYVLAVGGTSLYMDASGDYVSEIAWAGSGGGMSAFEQKPPFQKTNLVPFTNRSVPDVSYNADPNTGYSVYIGNYDRAAGWITLGGTSAGAPQWAALIALSNASRSSPLSFANASLYALAGINYPLYFFDVTSGNNGGYSALPKYDLVTGLGSPIANQIVPALPQD